MYIQIYSKGLSSVVVVVFVNETVMIFILNCQDVCTKKVTLKSPLSAYLLTLAHRIKNDRMENSVKGIRIWHCAFAASIILCSNPTWGG